MNNPTIPKRPALPQAARAALAALRGVSDDRHARAVAGARAALSCGTGRQDVIDGTMALRRQIGLCTRRANKARRLGRADEARAHLAARRALQRQEQTYRASVKALAEAAG